MKIIIVIKIYFIFLSKLIKSFSSSPSRSLLSLSCVELLLNARHYKSPFWFIAKSCVLKLLICVIYANQGIGRARRRNGKHETLLFRLLYLPRPARDYEPIYFIICDALLENEAHDYYNIYVVFFPRSVSLPSTLCMIYGRIFYVFGS